MTNRALGTLTTAAEDTAEAVHRIPGRRVRNDGVHEAALVPGQAYRLAHDGVGWQLTAEGERPHAYLVDDGLGPVGELELADGVLVLQADRQYVVAQDDAGQWVVHEHVPAMS